MSAQASSLRALEKAHKLASVLGAAYGLKVLAEAGKATPTHVENTLSMLLRASTVSELSAFLEYQINRSKPHERSDYKAMLDLLGTLNSILDLSNMESRKWKEIVTKAFLNFKWVCSKAEIEKTCAQKCAKDVIESLKDFNDSKLNEMDKKVTNTIKCIIDNCMSRPGGRHGRYHGR